MLDTTLLKRNMKKEVNTLATRIVIDATVGAGKSTLMGLIEEQGYTAFPEPVINNPLLDKFYHDRKTYSFPTQIFFANERFEHNKQFSQVEKAVGDRSIYCDAIFAKMLRDSGEMEDVLFDTYEKLMKNMLEHCTPPTLMIYLKISVDEAIQRIQKRGRSYEQIVERAYWEDLNKRYEEYFQTYNHSPLIIIDVTNRDFENDMEDRKYVFDQINQKLIELGHKPINVKAI